VSGPGVIMGQKSSTDIVYFGNAPYPTTGDLRAGNDAGLILAYRNAANNKDLPGFGIGAPGLADSIVFGGALAIQQTDPVTKSAKIVPVKPNVVILGDAFEAFEQVVANAVVASSFYDGVHTPSLFQMAFEFAGINHSVLSTQDGSLVLRAGDTHTDIELFNNNLGEYFFRPFNGNRVKLGDAGNGWGTLFLKAGTITEPQMHLATSVAPTTPSEGQLYYDGTGLFFVDAGGTPHNLLGAGGGASLVSLAATQDSFTTVPAAVLVTPALLAGHAYRLVVSVLYLPGNGGIAFAFTTPGITTAYGFASGVDSGGTVIHKTAVTTTPTFSEFGSGTPGRVQFDIAITPSANGVVTLMFAQGVGDGTPSSVLYGTTLETIAL
jgi:hypothetical protein